MDTSLDIFPDGPPDDREIRLMRDVCRFKKCLDAANEKLKEYRISKLDLIDRSKTYSKIIRVYGWFHGFGNHNSFYETLMVVTNDRRVNIIHGDACFHQVRYLHEPARQTGRIGICAISRYEMEGKEKRSSFITGWEKDDEIEYRGHQIKWLRRIKVCAICKQHCENMHVRHYDWPFKSDGPITDDDILRLDQMSHASHRSYSLHDTCNPRGKFISDLKKTAAKNGLAYGENGENTMAVLKSLGECWPSFRINEPKGKRLEKQRIIRKWAKRNPLRVSTHAARNFFKMTIGISNLESFIKQSKQNQKEPTK